MKNPRNVLLLALVLLVSPLVTAQTFPSLSVKGQDRPLRMDKLAIDINIVGRLATTTMEMRFVNELDRVLEGQFAFPLGEGQAVSRFAMSLGENLREGVVVEKARGRQVFESIVRKEIDPGLLEMTKGNNFKARVYPIPANGHKTIVIAYEHELPRGEKGLLYSLPLKFEQAVAEFSAKAQVIGQGEEPAFAPDELATFRFDPDTFTFRGSEGTTFTAETQISDFKPGATLAFYLPEGEGGTKAFVEDGYFYVDLVVPPATEQAKTLPTKLGLLWDVSNSGAERNLEKEMAVLDGYLSKIGNVEIELIPFSNTVHSIQKFAITDGETETLLDALSALVYDGGTQLGAIDLEKFECDEFVLVSDGLSNFGSRDLVLNETPVQILNSAASADHAYLSYLAQASGGQYLNLLELKTTAAVELLSQAAYQFLGAEFNPQEIEEVYPNLPTPLRSDHFTLAGKIPKPGAQLRLKFGIGGVVTQTMTVDLKAEGAKSGLLPRIWAQKKITQLDMRYEENKAELTQLGTDFGIVTRNTSLIVLDRLNDYVLHRIEPPTELLADYQKAIAREDAVVAKTEKERLERVVKMFDARKAWWEKEFKFGKGALSRLGKNIVNAPRQALAGMSFGRSSGNSPSPASAPMSNRARRSGSADPFSDSEERPAVSAAMSESEEDDAFGALDAVVAGGTIQSSESLILGPESQNGKKITLKKWTPDMPYLKALQAAKTEKQLEVYLEQKEEFATSSAFYLDVADFFVEHKQPEVALRVLSNIAEMELESHQLLRILGYRLQQLGHHGLAVHTFREVLKNREEEPQSHRDLGLALAKTGKIQKAVELLYNVATGVWNSRFPEIELVSLGELNALIAEHQDEQLDLGAIDPRLLKNLPTDVRVILTWDADATDMDLWVTDPNGELCKYDHRDTHIGGHMSADFTGGYGPEEFLLKKAQPGKYHVKVHYYGNRQQLLAGATTIQVSMITNFGRPNEEVVSKTLRLRDVEEKIEIGQFQIAATEKK